MARNESHCPPGDRVRQVPGGFDWLGVLEEIRQAAPSAADLGLVGVIGMGAAEEAVELPIAHDVQRRARDVMTLLVAGRHEPGLRMNGQLGLP